VNWIAFTLEADKLFQLNCATRIILSLNLETFFTRNDNLVLSHISLKRALLGKRGIKGARGRKWRSGLVALLEWNFDSREIDGMLSHENIGKTLKFV
jgi:hypothetical protein